MIYLPCTGPHGPPKTTVGLVFGTWSKPQVNSPVLCGPFVGEYLILVACIIPGSKTLLNNTLPETIMEVEHRPLEDYFLLQVRPAQLP